VSYLMRWHTIQCDSDFVLTTIRSPQVVVETVFVLLQLRNHILYLVENYRALIVVGETGCGKTTQIPQVINPTPSCLLNAHCADM
jgi:Tfp pilus assembly pilus retraction ATPase PilT